MKSNRAIKGGEGATKKTVKIDQKKKLNKFKEYITSD
jgi:hypothetical protein